MQEFTEKDCMQTEKEASIQNRVVVLPSKVLPEHYTGQLFFCTNIQKTENPRHSIAHLVSLSTGEAWHCWNRDAARTVGGKGTAPALPDPSIWGAGFTWTFPRIFWIQFSAGWTLCVRGMAGKSRGSMELCNDAEGLPVSDFDLRQG